MKVFLTAVMAVLPFLAVQTASAFEAPKTKRLIVTLEAGSTAAQRADKAKTLGGTVVNFMKTNGATSKEFEAMVVEVPAATKIPSKSSTGKFSAAGASGAVSAAGGFTAGEMQGVLAIEEDFTIQWIDQAAAPNFRAIPFPNTGKFLPAGGKFLMMATMGGEFPWGIKRVNARAAWDEKTQKGAGVKVAIIDTGVKSTHPDLDGQVIGGYNAITKGEKEDDYQDDNGHGTHVAGTIGAKHNDSGVVGVAPRASLYAVKVLDANGSGSLSAVIDGIVWAVNNGIQVANMSLGSALPSESMHRAVRYAAGRGMVIVAAAGNSGGGAVGYPAAYPETIAISASTYEDKLASFSSVGPEVDFILPGEYIVSTWKDNNTISISGTSMACPHGTGLAALAIKLGARGIGGPDGVKMALQKAATSIGLKATEQGYGMIDARKLLTQ